MINATPDTYFTLYQAQLNLNQFKRTFWAMAAIHAPFRKSAMVFEKFNAMNINYLREKEKEFLLEHVEWNGELGQYNWEQPRRGNAPTTEYRGIDGLVPVYKSAEDAEDAEEFNRKWEKLMRTEIKIVW